MLKISRKYAHFLLAVIQSGVTSAIASAVVSFRLLGDNLFLSNWLGSWLTSWALMVPIVLFCRADDPTSDGLVDERRCLTGGLSEAVLAHSCRREAIPPEIGAI